MPATSQLDWPISMTAISVLSGSRVARDLLKSLGCGMERSVGCFQRRRCLVLAARPIASSTAAAHAGLRAERPLAIAMTTPPRPFRKIVGHPRPQGKTRLPSQPDDHGDPFKLICFVPYSGAVAG